MRAESPLGASLRHPSPGGELHREYPSVIPLQASQTPAHPRLSTHTAIAICSGKSSSTYRGNETSGSPDFGAETRSTSERTV